MQCGVSVNALASGGSTYHMASKEVDRMIIDWMASRMISVGGAFVLAVVVWDVINEWKRGRVCNSRCK